MSGTLTATLALMGRVISANPAWSGPLIVTVDSSRTSSGIRRSPESVPVESGAMEQPFMMAVRIVLPD